MKAEVWVWLYQADDRGAAVEHSGPVVGPFELVRLYGGRLVGFEREGGTGLIITERSGGKWPVAPGAARSALCDWAVVGCTSEEGTRSGVAYSGYEIRATADHVNHRRLVLLSPWGDHEGMVSPEHVSLLKRTDDKLGVQVYLSGQQESYFTAAGTLETVAERLGLL